MLTAIKVRSMCPGSTSINSVNFSFDFIGRQIYVTLYQAVYITSYGLSNANVVAKVVPGQVPMSHKVQCKALISETIYGNHNDQTATVILSLVD